MRSFRRGRNLIGLSCLLALTAVAAVAQAQSAAPAVSSIAIISSPAQGDTYELGERVEVKVDFDRAVTATGEPQVALTVGTQTRRVTLSAWGTRSLYFYYTVQEADRDENGISIDANSLSRSGGTITATDGTTDADLTHGAVAADRGNKVNGSLVRRPGVREISVISSPAKGDTYGSGEEVEVAVDFDRAVTATGEPQVALTVGTQTRYATFLGWGSQSLYFSYIVQRSDRDEDGLSIDANSLTLNGGTIKAFDGITDAVLTHAAVAADRGNRVNGSDGAPPGVREVAFIYSPARDETFERGETVEVRVGFDRVVTVTGQPQVALTIGTQTRHATLSAWSSQSLYFSYTVQEADRDQDGISIASNSLSLDGGTIKAADGTTDAVLTHAAVAAQPRSKVNGALFAPPRVSHIALRSSPASGDTYHVGEEVEVVVEFDRAVTATGRPQVALTIGTQARQARFFGWSRQSLFFKYRVQEADRDEDGISIAANSLSRGGGTVKAADGTTDAVLTHGAVATQPRSKVHGNRRNDTEDTPPGVTEIALHSSPARGGTYGLGETVEVVVEFDRAVTATGRPQVALTIGAQTRHANLSGRSRQSLFFEYEVQEEDRDEDGISIAANALALNDGTIRAAGGTTDADLAHPELATERGSKVDGTQITPPRVRDIAFISSPARRATYELGETIEIRVEFDRAVTTTGSPHVVLTIGAQTRHATLSAWSSQSLYFKYAVREADRDEDGVSIAANALLLNGGAITNADGTADADLTHEPVAETDGKVNGSLITPPSAWGIAFDSSPALGTTYELGETIEVRVEFDRAVQVTGSPQVALTIGTETRQAAYALSWRDPRYAHFSYAVQEGDRDEDGISIAANALALNGGTIAHADDPTTGASIAHSGVAADLTRKVNGSLVTQPMVRAIYLDNHVPPPSGDTYVRGEIVRVWVEFDRDVTVTGRPLVALTIGSQTRHATYSGYSTVIVPGGGMVVDEDVLSFDYLVQATDRDEDGISIPANALGLSGGTITHAASPASDADLAHGAVPADPGRKVNGSQATP